MALETGNYIGDLIAANPAGSDSEKQGDDHLRLIKKTLLNSFAGFSGAVVLTGVESQGASTNEYIVTIEPAPAVYTERMLLSFMAAHTNSGAATLSINNMADMPLTAATGADLSADSIIAGQEVLVVFDGVRFRLLTGSVISGGGGTGGDLPSQGGQAGKYLSTDGFNAFWKFQDLIRNHQTSAYTIQLADISRLVYWTGVTNTTIGLQPASTLGANWFCYVYNASANSNLTLDPTGSETINGAITHTLLPGVAIMLQCNGLNFIRIGLNELPNQSGNTNKFLKTDGVLASWADPLPAQSGQGGKWLTTNGTIALWDDLPPGGGEPAEELPPQAGFEGLFLSTDGALSFWDSPFPSQAGNSSYVLSTNGVDPQWVEHFPIQTNHANQFLMTNGTAVSWNSPFPPQSGQAGRFLFTDGATTSWENAVPTMPVVSFSGSITVVVGDSGKLFRFTGGAATLTLPAASTAGNGGFVYIQNAGSGNLTVTAPQTIDGKSSIVMVPGDVMIVTSNGSLFYRQVLQHYTYTIYNSSTTWTRPDNASFVYVECIGAGGGGANETGATATSGGAGGEFQNRLMTAATAGTSQSITVGSGGAGAPNGSTTGGSKGGDTGFGSLLYAWGGNAGGIGANACGTIPRSILGAATTATAVSTYVIVPQAGYGGYNTDRGGYTINGGAGGGGSAASGGQSTFGGNGGAGNSSAGVKGGNGSAPGGGGGGSANNGGGGNGGNGTVRVWTW